MGKNAWTFYIDNPKREVLKSFASDSSNSERGAGSWQSFPGVC
jgi:hypothetical protein